jgi:prepilin-type processing-associated H-X9-DG protein
MYADGNDGRIVNGMGGVDRPKEKAWVGQCWASNYETRGQLPKDNQLEVIRNGALFPYCENEELYRCPTGYRGEMLTYAVMDSMNGIPREDAEKTKAWIHNRMDIPDPTNRAVFIDEGWVTPDSFAVHYTQEKWWDDPPVRHGDGTNLSFADGHEEYWKWKGTDTIKMGKDRDRGHPGNHYSPETLQGFQDLYKMQKATWGVLGYTPSH